MSISVYSIMANKRYYLIALLVALMALLTLSGYIGKAKLISYGSTRLYPIHVGDKYGYIDKDGKFAINPQFDTADNFYEDMASVTIGDKVGFIDKDGKFVINPQFDDAYSFNEGMAAVSIAGKWGFIDRQGKFAINPQSYGTMQFSENLAWVNVGGKFGYIDKEGKFVIEPQFINADDFSEDLAAVSVDGRWGYIDKLGKFAINPQFDFALTFNEGLAAVSVGGKMGYINREGKFAINPQFNNAHEFSEGLAAVSIGEEWGYIDKQGKIVINPQFNNAHEFSEGLAAVSVGKEWGYIDKHGEIVVNPLFNRAKDFTNGIAMVTIEHKDIYINQKGDWLYPISHNITQNQIKMTGISSTSDSLKLAKPLSVDSKDLSRDEAKDILSKTYHGNKIYGTIKSIHSIPVIEPSTEDLETKQMLEKLKDAGYIDISITKAQHPYPLRLSNIYYDYQVTFKPKLLPYIENKTKNWDIISAEVKIAEYAFNEVTGIRKLNDNECIVEFSEKISTNPLSEIFPLRDYASNQSQQAHFVKYDDGWRNERP